METEFVIFGLLNYITFRDLLKVLEVLGVHFTMRMTTFQSAPTLKLLLGLEIDLHRALSFHCGMQLSNIGCLQLGIGSD